MELNDLERLELVERASTIAERLGQNFCLGQSPKAVAGPENCLSNWDVDGFGYDSTGSQRSANKLGLSSNEMRHALARPRWLGCEPLPEWLVVAERILAAAGTCAPIDPVRFEATDTDGVVRFKEFYRPFVLVGREILWSSLPQINLPLAKSVFSDVEQVLVIWLSNLFGAALEREFERFETRAASRETEPGLGCRHLYETFLSELLATGLKAFFIDYCVATRWGAEFVLRWREVIAELLQRLKSDLPAIAEKFAPPDGLRFLTQIEMGLSDPHKNGRHVMRLHFESGLKIIYKPRGVSLDIAYENLLEWLAKQGAPLDYRPVGLLDRGDYAWVEHVPHYPCRTPADVEQFCQNAGALLCLSYVLDAVDLHDANIIACGVYPVPIDLETLLQPRIAKQWLLSLQTAQRRAMQLIEQSVLRSCLLSNWKFDLNGEVCDVGCLGALFGSGSTATYQRYEESNPIGPETMNGIEMEQRIELYSRWTVALVNGFRKLYCFFENRRDELLSPNGPLTHFSGQPIRLVIRDTGEYIEVQHRALAPEVLRDGAARSIQIRMSLRDRKINTFRSEVLETIIQSEIKALENFDIPLFSTTTDGNAIEVDTSASIFRVFGRPSYQTVVERMRQLGSADLARQVQFIGTAIGARLGISAHDCSGCISHGPDITKKSGQVESDQLQREAIAIGNMLWEHAISGDDRSLTWIAPRPIAGTDKLHVGVTPLDFYSGRVGIALFAAALHRATGQKNALELAQRLSNLLIRNLDLSVSLLDSPNRKNLGAMNGTGALLYALAKIGEVLADQRPIEAAKKLVAGFKLDTLESSDCLNIADGAAGGVLGLLALREHGDALEKAEVVGQYLLRAVFGKRCQTLTNRLTQLSASFAYGASGIAYTFARLYRSCGRCEFSDASLRILQFIDSCEQQEMNNSWCHGHAGLTLARLKCEAYLAESNAISQIEKGLERILGSSLGGLDTLCCGTFGRLDILVTASEQLNRPELLTAAYGQAGRTIFCSAGKGFRLFPDAPRGYFDPGLFKGISGVGYELLRLACPAKTPSVLSWE